MAGQVNKRNQGQHDAQEYALHNSQRELGSNNNQGVGERPPTPEEQVAQIARLREMQHGRDNNSGKRRLGHVSEKRRQE